MTLTRSAALMLARIERATMNGERAYVQVLDRGTFAMVEGRGLVEPNPAGGVRLTPAGLDELATYRRASTPRSRYPLARKVF